MHISRLLCSIPIVAAFALGACTLALPFRDRSITILTYNTQNLFDDHSNGFEYEEFDPNRSDWSTAEYYRRLEDIARVIRDSQRGAPDVVALEEVEHLGVLEDLESRFLSGLGYRYLFAPESSSPITVGVLSRVPVLSVATHDAYLDDEVDIRPMLEVELSVRGERLLLFVCHWKSKSGGAAETEPYRIASAAALASVVAERDAQRSDIDIVVVGDLNENVDEYLRVGGAYQTAILPPSANGDDLSGGLRVAGLDAIADSSATFYSPWFSSDVPGSYYFRGVWESIDHVLLSSSCFDGSGFEFAGFTVVKPQYALTAEGTPLAYSRTTGTGFSDHLPLLVTLELVK